MSTDIIRLAEYGFSYRLIAEKAGCSKEHVAYVLRKEEVRVSDYRNGESSIAKQVLHQLILPKMKLRRRKAG